MRITIASDFKNPKKAKKILEIAKEAELIEKGILQRVYDNKSPERIEI